MPELTSSIVNSSRQVILDVGKHLCADTNDTVLVQIGYYGIRHDHVLGRSTKKSTIKFSHFLVLMWNVSVRNGNHLTHHDITDRDTLIWKGAVVARVTKQPKQ